MGLSREEARNYNDPNPQNMNGFRRNAIPSKLGGCDISSNGEVSCLIMFDDTDHYESLPMDVVFEADQKLALRICEQRLLVADEACSPEGTQ